jgi:hypothetical protein
MAATQARAGSRSAGRRTNSLAFAKHDCHTCAALKTDCDRQRPRCGTCLSNQRKCDGFAIPLVWKDLAVAQSPQSVDTRLSQLQQPVSRGHAEFKFIRGRPKQKRKPRTGRLRVSANSQGHSPVEVVPLETALEESPPTSADTTQSVPATSYDGSVNTFGKFLDFAELRQNLCTNTNKQMKDEVTETVVDNFWNDSPESIELITGSDDSWDPIDPETLLPNIIQHGIGPFAIGFPNNKEIQVLEKAEQCVFEQQFSLSPMVLYQDLTQKYSSVLEMCESLRKYMWRTVNSDLIQFRQRGVLRHTTKL